MKTSFISLISFLMIFNFSSLIARNKGQISIIPEPVKISETGGWFRLGNGTKIIYSENLKEFDNIAFVINDFLGKFHGKAPLRSIISEHPHRGDIFIFLDKKSNLPGEGYRLEINKGHIELSAPTFHGLFNGIQSLVQMLPADSAGNAPLYIPCALIEDYPRFSWRGLHLDVCRHFMPKEFVLKYLDYMAMHKLNVFHFHLTEDQGWRIEIKRYPNLTETGSLRKETRIGKTNQYDGTPHGGFYTQDEIKEIVAYAAKRYITVVPEIEMPGHAMAALASYPELGCTGGPYEVKTRWGVFDDVLCAGKETTFLFLEDVLTEVMELFPSEYIHIGGDECPKTKWHDCNLCQRRMQDEGLADEHQLQSYFIQRIEKFINSKGRKIIGWDEILEGGLAPNAAVMSWRGVTGGIAAAKERHFVVMSPGTHCYLDHYQADPATQPLAIGGLTTLEKIYGYEPVPEELSAEESKYIMGAQGNVWTEYIPDPSHAEYMVYPRAAALSEVVWSPKEKRDYNNFLNRMKQLTKIYDRLELNYCKTEFTK